MIEFISLSDLHIEGDDSDKPTEAVLDFIKKKFPAAYLLLAGDITDDGNGTQCNKAKALLLSRWWGRLDIVPGNHDKGFAGNLYDSVRSQKFDQMISLLGIKGKFHGKLSRPVVNFIDNEKTKIMIIALDSCLETKHFFDFASGKIGFLQRWYLKRLLNNDNYVDYIKIVILHHHPFIRNNFTMCLWDWRKFMDIVAGRVDILVFGHRHIKENCKRQAIEYKIAYILANGSPKADKSENRNLWRIAIDQKNIQVDEIVLS